jgi:hypothetical protein
MEPYLFHGVVLPERAQLSLTFGVKFSHLASGITAEAQVSVVLNQAAVWVESEHNWDIFDLRNVVKNIVQGHLAMIGYLKGYAYDVEITRVLSRERRIDYVFGIDIPCVVNRNPNIDLNEALLRLREKTTGENGVFLHRCFDDLVSAMKHADDTGFYCYRAIESLRHHCASLNGCREASKAKQWETFREVAVVEEKSIRSIKLAADPLRHGEPGAVATIDRAELFNSTWGIVDAYLNKI